MRPCILARNNYGSQYVQSTLQRGTRHRYFREESELAFFRRSGLEELISSALRHRFPVLNEPKACRGKL